MPGVSSNRIERFEPLHVVGDQRQGQDNRSPVLSYGTVLSLDIDRCTTVIFRRGIGSETDHEEQTPGVSVWDEKLMQLQLGGGGPSTFQNMAGKDSWKADNEKWKRVIALQGGVKLLLISDVMSTNLAR